MGVEFLTSYIDYRQILYASLTLEGEPLAELTACRWRRHPRDFAHASTFVYTIDDKKVIEAGRKILSAINYTGVAEIEFKRHEKTNKLYFLEVNPRTWAWHTLVRTNHGNWIAALQAVLDGKEFLLPSTQVHACWVKFVTDLPMLFLEFMDGNITFMDIVWDYRRKSIAFGTWDKKDWLPFIAEWCLLPYLIVKRGF